jgi:hypothetical protein
MTKNQLIYSATQIRHRPQLTKMLTYAEHLKIRLEEQFRLEVRKQLEEKKSNPSRFWTFFNSSFGLWMMSAILVTWVGQSACGLPSSLTNRAAKKPGTEEERRETLYSYRLALRDQPVDQHGRLRTIAHASRP